MTFFDKLVFAASASVGYMSAATQAKRSSMSGLEPPAYEIPPLFDVALVVPSYMETKYLPGLLETARNQTMPFKNIVVADSSPPGNGTKDIARSFGADVVELPERTSPAIARNAGAALVPDADMLVFADADVLLSSQFVEHVTSTLEGGAAAVHPKEAFYDSVMWNALFYPYAWVFRARRLTKCCVGVWRSVHEDVGGYDEACSPFSGCSEDLDYGARIMEAYGRNSVRVLGCGVGISARRQKRRGLTHDFNETIRGYSR